MSLQPLLLARGLDPSPGPARSLLREELAKAQYSDGGTLVDRLLEWVQRHWNQLNDSAERSSALLSPLTTAVLGVLVIGLLAYVLPRVRRERRAGRGGGPVLEDLRTSAQAYRERAASALRHGRHGVAVVEAFRAIARGMTDRTVLSGEAGQTAHEIGQQLAAAFPSYAVRLGAAADLFDAVRYGRATVTRQQAEAVIQLDTELARARPVLAASGGVPSLGPDVLSQAGR